MFIKQIGRPPFVQFLADPQAAYCGVLSPLLFVEAADPSFTRVFFPVSPEYIVNLIHKAQRETLEF
jgi:hypothetical protein